MNNALAAPTLDAIAPKAPDEPAGRFELRHIDRPHPDIELGVQRAGLDYLVCAPDRGVNTDTGLVLFFVGYGMEPCGRYVRSLLSYLANKHNCIAASVDYFGAALWESPKCRWVPHPNFFTHLKKFHGIEVNAPKGFDVKQLRDQLSIGLRQRGIARLDPACVFLLVSPEYHSMGFLPALDGIQVAHCLRGEFALNKRRLFAFGTSYGGYIASLMVKLAPRTFRMVVDNSGFSSAEDDIWNVYGMAKWFSPEGVAMNTFMTAAFSQDVKAPNFFSPAHKDIRNLLNPGHVHESSTRLYGYHSVSDEVAPTAAKLKLREVYAGKLPYELEIIDAAKIDGRVFKDLSHGLRASMRGLFDRSYDKFQRDGEALADETDFDLDSRYSFPSGAQEYVVSFSQQEGVRAQLI
jgi:hypothetical protein